MESNRPDIDKSASNDVLIIDKIKDVAKENTSVELQNKMEAKINVVIQ